MNLRVGGDPELEGEKSVQLLIALSQAIRYAIRNGARVIVCTIGAAATAEGNVETSLKEAETAVSCSSESAGNQGRNIDKDKLL